MKKDKIIAILIMALIFLSGTAAGIAGSILYFKNTPGAIRLLWKKPETDNILRDRIFNLINLDKTQEEHIRIITQKYDKKIKEKERELRKEITEELTQMYAEVKTVLTEEQQKKLEKIIFSRRDRDYMPPPPPEKQPTPTL